MNIKKIIERFEEKLSSHIFIFPKELSDKEITDFYVRFMITTFNKCKYREIYVFCQKRDDENIIKISLNNSICGIVAEYDENYKCKLLIPETNIIRYFYYCIRLNHYINKFDAMNFDLVNM